MQAVNVRQAIAISLFRDQLISAGAAAKMAGESTGEMLTRLSRQGIAVVDYSEQDLIDEVAAAQAWVAPSKNT